MERPWVLDHLNIEAGFFGNSRKKVELQLLWDFSKSTLFVPAEDIQGGPAPRILFQDQERNRTEMGQ